MRSIPTTEANLGYSFSFKSHEIRFERQSRAPTVPIFCQPAPGIDADFAQPFVRVAYWYCLWLAITPRNSVANYLRRP